MAQNAEVVSESLLNMDMLLAHLKFGLLSVNPKCNFRIIELGDVGEDECYSGNTILYSSLN